MVSSFLDDYTRIVATAISADYTDNFDGDRFEPEPRNWRSLASRLRGKLARFGWVGTGTAK
jgi:hypothetical protein